MSTVRENLLKHRGYTPYCGAGGSCFLSLPRTHFIDGQFRCACGWTSNFEAEFITEYETAQAALKAAGAPVYV